MPATRIVAPAKAKKGEIVEIKTLINHVMETGFRRDNVGRAIPRDIITRFTCTYAGEEVFRMDLFTGVAANPFVGFTTSRPRPATWCSNGPTSTAPSPASRRGLDCHVIGGASSGSALALRSSAGLALLGVWRRARPGPGAAARHRSLRPALGQEFVSPETQAQQDDLTVNPGMLWVEQGEKLWREPAGTGGQVLRLLPWRAVEPQGRGHALSRSTTPSSAAS